MGGPTAPSLVRQVVETLPSAVLVLDRELRVLVAEGDAFRNSGYEPSTMPGRVLSELFEPAVVSRLEPPCREALEGRASAFPYESPVGGGRYGVRVRPLHAAGGHGIVGVVAVVSDESEVAGLQAQLRQARALLTFGSAVFERRTGWMADAALAALWGRDLDAAPADLIRAAVVADDQPVLLEAWDCFCREGGRLDVDFRLLRPSSEGEQVRTLHLVGEGLADAAGLLRAVTTLMDSTDLLRARDEAAERDRDAARTRVLLLEQVSDLLAAQPGVLVEVLRTVAALAVTAIGDGCTVHVVSDDGQQVEHRLATHRGGLEQARLQALLETGSRAIAEVDPLLRSVLRGGGLQHGPGDGPAAVGAAPEYGHRYVIAPARYAGRVLGALTLYRSGASPAFGVADAGLVQSLADRLGAAVATDREARHAAAQVLARQQLLVRLAGLSDDQGMLIRQLDRTETRERMRLADVVHDGPLQVVAAAVLRLDLLRARVGPQQAGVLDEVVESLQQSVDQLRTLIDTLAPVDTRAGLGPSLRALAAATFLGTDVVVEVRTPDHVGLDPGRKDLVHRIVREALLNARKHAQARRVRLDVVQDEGTLTVTLHDDGRGFSEVPTARGHVGLASMRARAAAAGADLQVRAADGGGTVVQLALRVERRVREREAADPSTTVPGGPGPADPGTSSDTDPSPRQPT